MRLRMATGGLLAVTLLGSAAASLAQDREDPRQRVITIRLRDVSLRAALDILMRDTGLTYQLPREIETGGITLDLESLPLEQALHAILTAQGLTYRYLPDARLYVIEPAPEPVPAQNPPEKTAPEMPPAPEVAPTEPPPPAPAPGEKTTRVIAIRYGDAAEISALFGGLVAQGRFTQDLYGGYGAGIYGGLAGTYGYGAYRMGSPFTPGYRGGFGYGGGYSGYPIYGPYGGYGVGYGSGYTPPGPYPGLGAYGYPY